MTQSLMQQLLKDAWRELPPALRKHHQAGPNRDVGWLDLEYPISCVFPWRSSIALAPC